MFKKSIALCLIYSIFLLATSPTQLSGQIQNKISNEPPAKIKTELENQPKLNVKKAFEKEISSPKFEIENAKVDFDKIEKEQYKQTQKKSNWSKKDTAFMVIFVAAVTVLVVLVAKYGKVPKCSEVSCNPDYDPDCYCED